MKSCLKAIFFIVILISLSWANIINVPADIDSIQGGINLAVDGDTVLVQPGTYIENINFNGKNIVVGSLTLTIGDTSYISQTVIYGDSSDTLVFGHYGSVVNFENGEDSTSVLCGFTVTNGKSADGGGIYIQNSSPRLSHLIVKNNTARGTSWFWNAEGGGIYCVGSNSILENVIVKANKTIVSQDNAGNGIYFKDSSPTLVNVEVIDNTVVLNDSVEGRGIGGGIYCLDSDPFFSNVTVVGNSAGYMVGNAQGVGGGIAFRGNCNPIFDTINRSNIYSNQAFLGNDLYSWSDSLINVVVDTFTVLNPDSTHAYPLNKFTFDILNDITGMAAEIENEKLIPVLFNLSQNYPNPFNPITNIEYRLTNADIVNLSVFNLLGQKVATLVNKNQPAGNYQVQWDASGFTSGIYIYQLTAKSQQQTAVFTKKLVLLK